ncbi:hypothetical protein LINPERHAP2_LOCUS7130 [Linum perenne]
MKKVKKKASTRKSSEEGQEKVFFPIYRGPTLQHLYVFVIDLRNKQRIVLNSVECDKDFDIVPQYKATFTRLVEYLQPFLLEHCKKDVSNY